MFENHRFPFDYRCRLHFILMTFAPAKMDNYLMIDRSGSAEEALKRSEANLRTIFETTDTIYVLLDTEFRILSYNRRAVEFAGNELKRRIKTSEYFLDYFPPERQQVLLGYLKDSSRGKNRIYEVSYRQKDKTTNWYHVRMFSISSGNTDSYGIMFAVSDITEKKRLEERLIERKVQEQKNIVRAVLKAQEVERNNLGQELHDNVNQILASTRMYLDRVQREPQTLTKLIPTAKKHLDLAIDEIRSLSRKQVTPQKGFDLKKQIAALLRDVSAQTATKFQCRIPSDLPIDEDLKLNIYRIVQEQTMNILKHAGASKANVVISRIRKTLFIGITDNGTGFDTTASRKGIGFSNMMNRIDSYNGELVIDSKPGAGCRIEVKIPVC
jgi:PAS domain S-box-containing protein